MIFAVQILHASDHFFQKIQFAMIVPSPSTALIFTIQTVRLFMKLKGSFNLNNKTWF